MSTQNLIALFLGILFLIISSWMLFTFHKFNKILSSKVIEKSGLSYNYIKNGYIVSIICTIFAILTTIILSINLYLN